MGMGGMGVGGTVYARRVRPYVVVVCGIALLGLPASLVEDGLAAPSDTAEEGVSGPVVRTEVKHDLSPPLRTIQTAPPDVDHPSRVVRPGPSLEGDPRGREPRDGVVQRRMGGAASMPAPNRSWRGMEGLDDFEIYDGWNVSVPDPNGDVGPNHYVQMVNVLFAIYDRSGTRLYGPTPIKALWRGFGGPCQESVSGDPIVLYDQFSGRWLLTQAAWIRNEAGVVEGHHCMAVSKTGDPTGAWWRYDFLAANDVTDYPKFGVWPDGYYMTANETEPCPQGRCAAQGTYAFERTAMLDGDPARMVRFELDTGWGMLPSDFDGVHAPPAGMPNYFVDIVDGQVQVWAFAVDWSNPSSSTMENDINLTPAPFDDVMCRDFEYRDCIPQPNVSREMYLDAHEHLTMFRLQYRNVGFYSSLVLNHTVDVGTDHAGIRWYELKQFNGFNQWSIEQQGTYAPDDEHRWNGSIAMDGDGNIALGYSISSVDTYPSIRYAGRTILDPKGTLPRGETSLIEGGGEQRATHSRWGDYSMMAVDPVDDCTFWYTNEYYKRWGVNWQTRIGSFKFPSCGPRTGRLEGKITDARSGKPINRAKVEINDLVDFTGKNGRYSFATVPTGTYRMKVSARLRLPQVISQVEVRRGRTIEDVKLRPAMCFGERASKLGTNRADELKGSGARDVIVSLGGVDDLAGLAGEDLLCSGRGDDTVDGGRGSDDLAGSGGEDRLRGGSGNDLCEGGRGKDSGSGCEERRSIP